jgi:hypothetical protein
LHPIASFHLLLQILTRTEPGYLAISQILGFGLNLEKHFLMLFLNGGCEIEN